MGGPKSSPIPRGPSRTTGRSKLAGEQEAESFADRVPTTIVRPPIVLGEGDRLGLKMFRAIHRSGIHVLPGRGRHRYSLIHAADLAELIVLAAQRGKRLPPDRNESPTGQGYYFAACEQDVFYDDLGQLIGTVLGRRRVLSLHIPTPLVWLMSGVMETVSRIERRPRYMHIDKVREITAGSWLCSPQRAVEDLGFAVKAPLIERLRQTAQWYRKEGWL